MGPKTTLPATRGAEDLMLPSRQLWVEESHFAVLDGPHAGTQLPLDQEIILIGRGDWCDLVLAQDPKSSKEHCEIRISDDGILVTDLGSRNGVFLDQVQIKEAYVKPGMRLRIGSTTLQLQSQTSRRKIEVRYSDPSHRLVGCSPRMRKVFTLVERLARRDLPLLLHGETGTGKSSIARAVHEQSPRKDGPFVVVNCGAIAANLIESLFFGYEKGAFTGAEQRHRGYFEQAHGGTLFLDEIAELPIELQPRLLDVLERNKVKPLGSERESDVDVRLISSTNRSLREEVEAGRFRQDLYYRLEVATLMLPPLRDRREDLPLLIEHILQELLISEDEHVLLTDAALQKLQGYLWPGNVRELRNVLQRAVAFLDRDDQPGILYINADDVELEPLGAMYADESEEATPPSPHKQAPPRLQVEDVTSLKEYLEEAEKDVIQWALQRSKGNVSQAARELKISRPWLHRRIKKFGLREEEDA